MNPSWLEDVQRALRRQGLPAVRRQRFLEELRDHAADLLADGGDRDSQASLSYQELNAALGTPVALAQAAGESYRAGCFAARHPWLTFVVLPVPLTLLAWIVGAVGMLAAFRGVDILLGLSDAVHGRPLSEWPTIIPILALAVDLAVRVGPPMFAAGLFSRWAEQMGHSWAWRLAACGLIAVLAGLLFTRLALPVTPGKGQWTAGFGFPGGVEQGLQLLLPLLAVVLTLGRRQRESPQAPGPPQPPRLAAH